MGLSLEVPFLHRRPSAVYFDPLQLRYGAIEIYRIEKRIQEPPKVSATRPVCNPLSRAYRPMADSTQINWGSVLAARQQQLSGFPPTRTRNPL
jgi:hypothetical protein